MGWDWEGYAVWGQGPTLMGMSPFGQQQWVSLSRLDVTIHIQGCLPPQAPNPFPVHHSAKPGGKHRIPSLGSPGRSKRSSCGTQLSCFTAKYPISRDGPGGGTPGNPRFEKKCPLFCPELQLMLHCSPTGFSPCAQTQYYRARATAGGRAGSSPAHNLSRHQNYYYLPCHGIESGP